MTFKRPLTALNPEDYILDAENFIRKVAPTLPDDVLSTLAREVVASFENDNGTSDYLYDPALLPYKDWFWPELAKVAPFSVSTLDFDVSSCWDYAPRKAWRMAQDYKKEREETSFSQWFWRVSAVQARRWQRALISKELHARRKMFILVHLAGLQPAPPLILNDFEDWKADLQKSEDAYRIEAARSPTPRHFEKLSELVETHVKTRRFLTMGAFSPPSFASMESVLAKKIVLENGLDFQSLLIDLKRSIMQPCWDQQVCRDAVLDAEQRLESLRATLGNPISKKKLLDQLRPVQILVGQCPACKSMGMTSTLPPSHLLCRCHALSWLSKSRIGEPKDEVELQTKFNLWALHALCGIPWESPAIALVVHQDMARIEAEINAIVKARECARKTQQTQRKAKAAYQRLAKNGH